MKTLSAHAKLNLNLHITGVRADGFHEIQSLFVPVSLFDEIQIANASKEGGVDEVTYSDSNNQTLTLLNDTVTRALTAMRQIAKFPPHKIRIIKNIPISAGMGGGSSDAGQI